MVTRKYKETERRIEEAKRFYSPEYFREAKFTAPDIPPWKRDLLAKKCSKETIHQFEQNAWREFSEWKQANAPSVNLYPPYQYSVQPML
ncbi:hypothetical protein NECAME_19229 [Necator americanus]|nr:hypothetical protein NECAME_19229 [Necator americanus]ETN71676.1 hypothetical protein NECAME_19229 [Necator americanus]